jgi:SOS response regulatory protein OraA/RecX
MKKNNSSTVIPAENKSTAIRKETSSPNQSPYLKAILSGAIKLMKSEKWMDDRAAASRYIKESSLMRG